jgi:serine/threonine protein phosphatase PrpC
MSKKASQQMAEEIARLFESNEKNLEIKESSRTKICPYLNKKCVKKGHKFGEDPNYDMFMICKRCGIHN